MKIETARYELRDFCEADRRPFSAYQLDPRYRRLYDLDESHAEQASALFSQFLSWQTEEPRRRFQLGVFVSGTGRLCGCAGLRVDPRDPRTAELGIELAPEDWGRYRLALEVADALAAFGFETLGLDLIVGSTASGNRRVARLARWFGARIVAGRSGPPWMRQRGWTEADWALTRQEWTAAAEARGAQQGGVRARLSRSRRWNGR